MLSQHNMVFFFHSPLPAGCTYFSFLTNLIFHTIDLFFGLLLLLYQSALIYDILLDLPFPWHVHTVPTITPQPIGKSVKYEQSFISSKTDFRLTIFTLQCLLIFVLCLHLIEPHRTYFTPHAWILCMRSKISYLHKKNQVITNMNIA